MRKKRKLLFIIPLAICGILLVVFIGGQLVQHLWNWLLPPLFGWPRITFWQAFGLLALCRILFGGSGFHGRRRSGRWERMPPEERERFRQRMRERFGFGPATGESTGQ
jgi:hypothetical protein